MAHKHSIYDTDLHFVIDPVTRQIINQSPKKTTLIQGDHNSERFTFEMPRTIEGHDMSLCDKVEIHYINTASNKIDVSKDFYKADDVQISPDGEDVVIFSWLISGLATKYDGDLAFLIKFKCLSGDVVDYKWNTDIHSNINVGLGMDNADATDEEYIDLIEKWKLDTLAEIEAKGQAVLSSLPEEYTSLVTQEIGTSNTKVVSQKAVTELTADFRAIDFSTATTGYITNSGVFTETTAFSHTEPIQLKKNETITVTAQGYQKMVSIIAKVEGESYISLVNSIDADVRDYEYTASEDCEVVISYNNAVEHSAKAELLVKTAVKLLEADVQEIKENQDANSVEFVVTDVTVTDMLEDTEYTDGYEVTESGLVAKDGKSASSYLDISRADKLNLQIGKGDGTRYAMPKLYFYDENQEYVGFFYKAYNEYEFEELDGKQVIKVDTIPKNAFYVRFSIETSLIGTPSRVYHIITTEYTYSQKLQGDYYEKNMNELCGYKANTNQVIVNMGDSLFGAYQAPNDISTFLAEISGATVHNCGFGGCQMTPHSLDDWKPFSMCNLADAIASGDFTSQTEKANAGISGMPSYFIDHVNLLKSIDFSNVDIITISYGTNDWSANDSLENTENLYDVETVKGALRHSIETIGTAYPNIRFLICTPMWRCWFTSGVFQYDSDTYANGTGKKLIDYVNAIKECAAEYHVPVCDFYNEMGLNRFCWQVFFTNADGTHPHADGRYLMAKKLSTVLSAY